MLIMDTIRYVLMGIDALAATALFGMIYRRYLDERQEDKELEAACREFGHHSVPSSTGLRDICLTE